jgi:mono/diheme cytochrome c family protein
MADLEVAAARGTKTRLFTMLITLVGVLVVLVSAGLWVVGTGAYDVAATAEHWPVTEWALSTLQHRSVAKRAEAAGLPVALPTDDAAIDHGFEHFHAMCVECHGAPGFDRGDSGQGMNPRPPRLEAEAHEWTDAELFWITEHGIRLAGMPAFGPTHSDEEIAAIVAFIRVMETMTEEEYAERVRALESGEALHEH